MSILTPQKTVRIGNTDVTVRDLPWPVMKQFLDRLSHQVSGLIGNAVSSTPDTSAAAIGSKFLDQLPSLVGNSVELSEYLVNETCAVNGTKLEGAWLQQRSATEFLTLLDAALEVVFNEEFVRLGKSVAERVQSAFNLGGPARTATALSARPSTSSSGKDGPTRTRVDSPLPNSSSSAT
jgi:hypothetical protein